MQDIGNRVLIFVGCMCLILGNGIAPHVVVGVLLMMFVACMGIYISWGYIESILVVLCSVLIVFVPDYLCFVPVLAYEITEVLLKANGFKVDEIKSSNTRLSKTRRSEIKLVEIESSGEFEVNRRRRFQIEVIINMVSVLIWGMVIYINYENQDVAILSNVNVAIVMFLSIIAICICVYCYYYKDLKHQIIQIRDDSAELQLMLQNKNKYLIEKQDYEIHVATLRERNRIAREIHDNVGHLLSRSILQTGALITVNKEADLKQHLVGLKDTLNLAMTSVRESVHDLHNDSIDVEASIKEIVKEMKDYDVKLECDISSETERNVKYCMISIVKEAISNILKHSSADTVKIVLREHPGFFQLIIEDNGEVEKGISYDGMGLSNIKDRIDAFNGNLNITADRKGFRVFESIPKLR